MSLVYWRFLSYIIWKHPCNLDFEILDYAYMQPISHQSGAFDRFMEYVGTFDEFSLYDGQYLIVPYVNYNLQGNDSV